MQRVESALTKPELIKPAAAGITRKPARAAAAGMIMTTAVAGMCLIYVIIILLPVLSLAVYSGTGGIKSLFSKSGIVSSIRVSFSTSALSLLLTFLLGTPAAFYIKSGRNPVLAKSLEILTGLPVVLPPAAAGMALLLVFGRNGPIGALLNNFGFGIVFTPYAVVLAQFFVSSGFYIQTLGTGIGMVDKEIYEVSGILGAGKVETFFMVVLPMVRKSAVAGLLMSWARALGEFGTTIIFAGNVEGRTRTLPLSVYTLMQTDIEQAAAVAVLLAILSVLALLTIKVWLKD